MIVCFSCNADTKEKIDSLLEKGHYKDHSELISSAIANLWLLDQELSEKGVLVIGENQPFTSSTSQHSKSDPSVIQKSKKNKIVRENCTRRNAAIASIVSTQYTVPDLFLRSDLNEVSKTSLDLPIELRDPCEIYTLDRWLFGQYNKILPIKANCRALAHLTSEHKEGVPFDIAVCHIAEAAINLGDYLTYVDRCHQIGRDDSLATAFPRSGDGSEKSSARYINQFVGSINSKGQLSGMLRDYRLAGLALGNGTRLLLTQQGVKFANFINPRLDNNQVELSQKISPEEIIFLLDHIRSYVPIEFFTFQTLIRAILGGADTPKKLEEALKSFVPTDSNRSLSQSFLTSQRSGALSRMADLGLIKRIRKGVRVSYVVTENGENFFATGN